jgi:hypothetical protein
MTTEQAFQNLVVVIMRAQKSGALELHEAVAVSESLSVVNKALGLEAPQQTAPVVTEAPAEVQAQA